MQWPPKGLNKAGLRMWLKGILGQLCLILALGRARSPSKASKKCEIYSCLHDFRNSSHLPKTISALIIDLVNDVCSLSPQWLCTKDRGSWTPLSICLTKGIPAGSCPANPGLPDQGELGMLSRPCWWQLNSPWRLRIHWRCREQKWC